MLAANAKEPVPQQLLPNGPCECCFSFRKTAANSLVKLMMNSHPSLNVYQVCNTEKNHSAFLSLHEMGAFLGLNLNVYKNRI